MQIGLLTSTSHKGGNAIYIALSLNTNKKAIKTYVYALIKHTCEFVTGQVPTEANYIYICATPTQDIYFPIFCHLLLLVALLRNLVGTKLESLVS